MYEDHDIIILECFNISRKLIICIIRLIIKGRKKHVVVLILKGIS